MGRDIDHIVFVSSNYPSKSRQATGTFVQQLVQAIARIGIKCSVINPVSIFDRRFGKFDPWKSIDLSVKENPITIFRPRYMSFSSKKIFSFNTDHLTHISFTRAVSKVVPYLESPPDMIYGHFLYYGGAAAIHVASNLEIPSCVAVGESSSWSVDAIGFQKAIHDLNSVSGVISVSTPIKRYLNKALEIPYEKIRVFPNGINLSLFYPRDRLEMRKKFGFPPDKFIVAFTGDFDQRKGAQRVLSSVAEMDNIGLLFIGQGPHKLESPAILYKGVLKHTSIPEMLSAADIFVLPTLAEGSCNAILEALACGLPVVTSKGEFNDEIVDETVAIRVDPLNISEITNAIKKLQDNYRLREELSINALRKINQYDINVRAKKIVKWLEEIKDKHNCKDD